MTAIGNGEWGNGETETGRRGEGQLLKKSRHWAARGEFLLQGRRFRRAFDLPVVLSESKNSKVTNCDLDRFSGMMRKLLTYRQLQRR